MVYTNRTEKCLTSQEPSNTKSTTSGSKTTFANSSSSNSSSSANNAWSKNASDNDKWKYNNMVRNERDKFNSMHFC
ncbi:uncharacterized protein LOC111680196 [Lucilia cuprina]|uniref:uncharacterized protein LOC111680196 n=1 Tax=Lucilia cuprina TaxID=7375 RepID=UPI001F0711D1|nr:uncharacterized protein LOC111680196 [Lucilia cuprina]